MRVCVRACVRVCVCVCVCVCVYLASSRRDRAASRPHQQALTISSLTSWQPGADATAGLWSCDFVNPYRRRMAATHSLLAVFFVRRGMEQSMEQSIVQECRNCFGHWGADGCLRSQFVFENPCRPCGLVRHHAFISYHQYLTMYSMSME